MTEVTAEVLASLSTPDQVDSRLGPLEFTDGAPARKSVETLYDHLDFVHGLNAFLTAFPGASTQAIRQGFLGIGVQDNSVLIFSELMDSSSLFLTANCDTVYYLGFVDLSDGPMVVETPPMALGTFDDMWFKWIIDFGFPGPDRGAGGKFLLLPPGYDGVVPEGGFYVGRSRTNRVLMLGRSFMQDSDPAPTVATIKSTLKIYPYTPGGAGTSVGTLLTGTVPFAAPADVPATTFVEGTGTAFNTIPPTDARFFETVHALLQDEPAEAGDPEIVGHLAELGIVKGKPFAPDDRMRRILEEAATVGNATSRALMFDSRGEEDVYFYPGLRLDQHAVQRWLPVRHAGPAGHAGGHQAVPAHRRPQARPAHPVLLRLHRDHAGHGHAPHRDRQPVPRGLHGLQQGLLRRRHDVHRHAAPRHPPGPVLVAHALRQPDPLAARDPATVSPGRQPELSDPGCQPRTRTARPPSTSAPSSPPASLTATGSRPMPGKGWFIVLRLYSPLAPFFDKSWRVGEVEPVA